METIHTLALVWMATGELIVMASIADISVPSGDVLIKKTFCLGCIFVTFSERFVHCLKSHEPMSLFFQ